MLPSAPPIAESLPLLDKINALESQLEVTEKPSSLAEQVDNLKRILGCEKKLTGQSLFQQVDEMYGMVFTGDPADDHSKYTAVATNAMAIINEENPQIVQAHAVQPVQALAVRWAGTLDSGGHIDYDSGVHIDYDSGGHIDYAEYFDHIMCPIAGHPDFDKGAYYHPIGCCCYLPDRNSKSECSPDTFICFPLVFFLWVGTLCYQPCGIICAQQCPWLGDCPFSKQRVTRSFVDKYPGKVECNTAMRLVPKGCRSQLVLENINRIKRNIEAPMTLRSHPRKAIAKKYDHVKFYGSYSYIESTLDDAEKAVFIRWDGNFIWISGHELTFDVSFWNYSVGNTVNFVGSGPKGPATEGGGRDWLINDDGTIALKGRPDLVLGV